MKLRGFFVKVPVFCAILCCIMMINSADEDDSCTTIKSKVAGSGLVEIGIKRLSESYYIFVYVDGRQYVAPMDEFFDVKDVNVELYAWVTYDDRGIVVYNVPWPFIDEFMRYGRLIIPSRKSDNQLYLSLSSYNKAWFNERVDLTSFWQDFRIGLHGPYIRDEHRYIAYSSTNNFSKQHGCEAGELNDKECVYDEFLDIEFAVKREHDDSWKNVFNSYACNIYQESRGMNGSFDRVSVRHWFIPNLMNGETYTLNLKDATCYNVTGSSHIFLKKEWLESPPKKCEYLDVLVEQLTRATTTTTTTTKLRLTTEKPEELSQCIIVALTAVGSLVFCCTCVKIICKCRKKKDNKSAAISAYQTSIDTPVLPHNTESKTPNPETDKIVNKKPRK